MTVLTGYNIIKEGNLQNVETYTSTLDIVKLTQDEINKLYDEDTSLVATTISGAAISGSVYVLQASFGESYKINTVKYSQNLTTLSGVTISYGSQSGLENTANLTLSGTTIITDVIGDARYIQLEHSCSPGVFVEPTEFFVEGVENPFIGYGTSPQDEQGTFFVEGTPVGYESSVPREIKVYNEYNSPIDIKVATAPVGSSYDDYILLGTSSSGEFYGLNEHGFSVPATEFLTLESDNLLDKTIDGLEEQWEIHHGQTQNRIYSDSEGLHINSSTAFGINPEANGNFFHGLMSKQTFTGNQSFTIKTKCRFIKSVETFYGQVQLGMGFSCGMPVRSTSYNKGWPNVDEYSTSRPARSGVVVATVANRGSFTSNPSGGSGYTMFYADGTLFQSESFEATSSFNPNGWTTYGFIGLTDFSNIVDGSVGNNDDATSAASFREFIITWDHVERTAYCYIDKLEIGRYTFENPPTEGNKIFLGFHLSGGNSIDCIFKDFEISTTNLYKQRLLNEKAGLAASSSSTYDTDYHPPSKIIDGIYSGYDPILRRNFSYSADQCWWAGDPTGVNEWVQVDFDEPKDIVSVGFVNPTGATGNNMFGSTHETAGKLLKTLSLVTNREGAVLYSLSNGFTTTNNKILHNTSGEKTVLSGTTNVKATFIDFYDYVGSTDCLVLEEMKIVEQYEQPVAVFPQTTPSGHVHWSRGVFNNMKPSTGSGLWKIDRHDISDVGKVRDSEMLIEGADFGHTLSYFNTTPGDMPNYPQAQTAFRHRGEGQGASLSNIIGYWRYYGHPAYLWRVFTEKHPIKAVMWGFYFNNGVINKFKIQYLKDGQNPNLDTSWADIPTIKEPYHTPGDYKIYRDYFINNNDGEYYTNMASSFPGDLGLPTDPFELPSDLFIFKDFRFSPGISISDDVGTGTVGSNVYLEFDEEIETTGIRFYVAETYDWPAKSNPKEDGTTVVFFSPFSTKAKGSYLSPVFDTETEINSERVVSSIQQVSTSSGTVLVRSSAEPPIYKNDPEFLSWKPFCEAFYGTTFDHETGSFTGNKRVTIDGSFGWPNFGIIKDTRVYFQSFSSDRNPFYYDYSTDSWGFLNSMGTTGEDTRADSRVRNCAVVLDDGAMYVASKEGEASSSRMMRYDFVPDEYNITGWRPLSVSRPPEADSCAMIGYGQDIYFFCNDGTTIRYNVDEGIWDPTLEKVPLHGQSTRNNTWPVLIGNKVYIIWGQGDLGVSSVPYIDVYDIHSNTWVDSIEMPYYPGRQCQAVSYGDKIYIMPREASTANSVAFSIFDTITNTFEMDSVNRLRSNNFNANQNITFVCGACWVYNDYVYTFSKSAGTGGTAYMDSIYVRGLRSTKLKREDWEPGYLPSFIDPVWGNPNSADIGWQEVSSLGEVMPQKRYFQFKIQIEESEDEEDSSLLERATLVTPQSIEKVPASGTSSFYLRTGISSEATYEGWYGGANLNFSGFDGYTWTIFNTHSREGYNIDSSYQCFDVPVFSGTYRESRHSPWVLKPTIVEYEGWFSSSRMYDLNIDKYATFSGSIYSMSSTEGREWGSITESIPLGSEGTYDTHSAIDPCVIRVSSSDYRMWYTGKQLGTNVNRIMYCTSTNGVSWSGFSLNHDIATPGIPLQADLNGVYAPSVLYDDESGLFLMWYSGLNADNKASVVRCESFDGVSWTNHRVSVPFGFMGAEDAFLSHFPMVIKDVDTFKMWYVGMDHASEERVLYTQSGGGIFWSDPIVVMYKNLHGTDNGGIGRLCTVSNRSLELPNQYLSGAKVKIYNE